MLQMLYRLAGIKYSKDSIIPDSDVKEWVIANGISDGTNPNGTITREQLAVMLYRYAKAFSYDLDKQANLSKYVDAHKVSTYAKNAFSWANGNGLISGTGKLTLSLQGRVTRSQIAVILTRFYDLAS